MCAEKPQIYLCEYVKRHNTIINYYRVFIPTSTQLYIAALQLIAAYILNCLALPASLKERKRSHIHVIKECDDTHHRLNCYIKLQYQFSYAE